MRFLLRRLLHSLVLLVSVSIVSFLLIGLAPGDFFDALRLNPAVSPDTIAALRSQHGIDQPLAVRYGRWIQGVVKGDWGFSLAYNAPAGPIVLSRAKNTLLLTGTAMAIAWAAALLFGMWAGSRAQAWPDWLASAIASTLLATPELVIGLLALLLAVRTGLFPAGGMVSPDAHAAATSTWAESKDVMRHLILPGLCLAAGSFPMLLLHVRSALREAFASPYLTAARGYGIRQHRLLVRHALPVAASPLLSLFGLSLGMLISSSLLIETIFSWPGLGQLMVEAIFQRDFFLVIDAGMLSVAFFILGNLLADVFLYAADPRLRTG